MSGIYSTKLTIKHNDDKREYSFILEKDPIFYEISGLRRTVVSEARTIPLESQDKVDVEITALGEPGRFKKYEDLSVEDFLEMTNCGKAEKGCIFVATKTRY